MMEAGNRMSRRRWTAFMLGLPAVNLVVLPAIGNQPIGPPRWGVLGEDKDLHRTIQESKQIVMICVYQVSVEEIRVPFAQVVLKSTIAKVLKGDHAVSDQITVQYLTDSLPHQDIERVRFIEKANQNLLGSLRIGFFRGETSDQYQCEWLNVPRYEGEMLELIEERCGHR